MDYQRLLDAKVAGFIAIGVFLYFMSNKKENGPFWLTQDDEYLHYGGLGMQVRNSSAGYIATRQAKFEDNGFGRVAFGHNELGPNAGTEYLY